MRCNLRKHEAWVRSIYCTKGLQSLRISITITSGSPQASSLYHSVIAYSLISSDYLSGGACRAAAGTRSRTVEIDVRVDRCGDCDRIGRSVVDVASHRRGIVRGRDTVEVVIAVDIAVRSIGLLACSNDFAGAVRSEGRDVDVICTVAGSADGSDGAGNGRS